MYFVSIDVGAQVAIILLSCGPYVVIVNCCDRFWTLGRGPYVVIVNCCDRFWTLSRAPCTKETLPDFREWCRVTRHPRVFRELMGCQRDTPILGRHRE